MRLYSTSIHSNTNLDEVRLMFSWQAFQIYNYLYVLIFVFVPACYIHTDVCMYVLHTDVCSMCILCAIDEKKKYYEKLHKI